MKRLLINSEASHCVSYFWWCQFSDISWWSELIARVCQVASFLMRVWLFSFWLLFQRWNYSRLKKVRNSTDKNWSRQFLSSHLIITKSWEEIVLFSLQRSRKRLRKVKEFIHNHRSRKWLRWRLESTFILMRSLVSSHSTETPTPANVMCFQQCLPWQQEEQDFGDF